MKQRGDTLIEVMIALAIVSSVIGMSYATASRALRTGRAAQERTEALKLVEGQIEILKATAPNYAVPATNIFSAGPLAVTNPSFCVDSAGVLYNEKVTPALAADLELDPLLSSVSASGVPTGAEVYHKKCALGQDARYKISIIRAGDPPGQSTFAIRARWERVGGGKDEVVIYYKLHQGMF
jgi:prepilin-type N-terminal cleavage/methylation domain-containing protein